MKKSSSKASSPKAVTTARNLQTRFDSGKEVLDYFEVAAAVVVHGGARSGAGRKPTGKLRKTVKLSPAAVRRIQGFARRNKMPNFSAALEAVAATL